MCDDSLDELLESFQDFQVDPLEEIIMSQPTPGKGFKKVSLTNGITTYVNSNGLKKVFIHDDTKRNGALQIYDRIMECK